MGKQAIKAKRQAMDSMERRIGNKVFKVKTNAEGNKYIVRRDATTPSKGGRGNSSKDGDTKAKKGR